MLVLLWWFNTANKCDAEIMEQHYIKYGDRMEQIYIDLKNKLKSGCSVSIEFENGNVSIFHFSDGINEMELNWDPSQEKIDSLLCESGLDRSAFERLEQNLAEIGCISISTQPDSVGSYSIGFRRIGMGMYYYRIYNKPLSLEDQKEVSHSNTSILYSPTVSFNYAGGAIGNQIFIGKEEYLKNKYLKSDMTEKEKVDYFVEFFRINARKSLELHISKTSPVFGSTKFGGEPEVPNDFIWPVDETNQPLSFLLQLECSAVAAYEIEVEFPRTGYLYFFQELSDRYCEGEGNSVRVIYSNVRKEQLHKEAFPDNLSDEYRLPEHNLSFKEQITYPKVEDISGSVKNVIDENLNEFFYACELIDAYEETGAVARIFGYAHLLQDHIVDDVDENILLLQVNSIYTELSEELMYGDCGSAYFYVSRKDFKNKQFDNLTFQTQGY